MKVHKLINGQTIYPIGFSIQSNLKVIQDMADSLALFILENYSHCECINLICRGSSGAIISALLTSTLATMTNMMVTIYHIKKEGEESHSGTTYPKRDSKYVNIIVDDFISSGRTMNAILDKIGHHDIDIMCVTGRYDPSTDDQFNDCITHFICSKY